MSEEPYVLAVENGDVVGCYRCNSVAPTVGELGAQLADKQHEPTVHFRRCKFCRETELGQILAYPTVHTSTEKKLALGLCQALNLLHWDGKDVPTVVINP